MIETTFGVPPNIRVKVVSARRLRLLSHLLPAATTPGDFTIELTLNVKSTRSTPKPFSISGTYKSLPWKLDALRLSSDFYRLEFFSHAFVEYLALHIVLLPFFRQLLLQRRVAMCLGSAVSTGHQAILISGSTGKGKTSLALGLMERGASLLGDEYLGLHEGGTLTPIIQSLALRRDSLSLAPYTTGRLSTRSRIWLQIARLCAILTNGYVAPQVHVRRAEVTDEVTTPIATLQDLVWLQSDTQVTLKPLERAEAVERLLSLQTLHDNAYGDVATSFLKVPYAELWRDVASIALRPVSVFALHLPAGATVPVVALDALMRVRN